MTNPVLAVLLSRSHSHRASIATARGRGVPLAAIARLDTTAIEHQSRRAGARDAPAGRADVSIPQTSSIDRDRRAPPGRRDQPRVSIPQPSSIDRDPRRTRASAAAARSLDPTAIEHRSRRLSARSWQPARRVSIPQPSSIDRDAEASTAEYAAHARVSIPQPSSINRDRRAPYLLFAGAASRSHSHRASIATPQALAPGVRRLWSTSRSHSHRASIATEGRLMLS